MGAEMVRRHRPFEPDADNTAVGKHDRKCSCVFFVRLVLFGQAFFFEKMENGMQIRLNGKPEHLAQAVTIGDLIREKGLEPDTIVVEHNLAIVATEALDRISLKDNDCLEILRFVGGG